MRGWLIEIREKKGFTQEQIATRCGISRQYYGMIESGARNASVVVAKRLGFVLEIDWQRFFDGEAIWKNKDTVN